MEIFVRSTSVTVVLLASLLLAVPSAAADSSRAVAKGDYGQRVIVSETQNLDPSGQRVVVRGRQFNPRIGVYVALCVRPNEGDAPSPCGGGVSIEHRGFKDEAVLFRDCIFRENRCQVTGSAVDVLTGSYAILENCLFVGNVSNTDIDFIGRRDGYEYNVEHGSGALTVFPDSKVEVRRCTFTDNWNGADDKGQGSLYVDSIFWRNVKAGGISKGERYELDILDGSGVRACFLDGAIIDLRGAIDSAANRFDAPDPEFDERFAPQAAEYEGIGYRPPAD